MRGFDRRGSAGLRQAAADGVAAYIAGEDAEVYNVIDAAVKQDAMAAALNLTALAADAVAALAAITRREPNEVLRSLHQGSSEQPASPDPADRGAVSLSGVQIVYPDAMDAYDWAMTEAKGWIEVTVHWNGGQKAITVYDPTRLAQEVQATMDQPGYFVDRALVVVPKLTKDAIEAAVTAIGRRGFADV